MNTHRNPIGVGVTTHESKVIEDLSSFQSPVKEICADVVLITEERSPRNSHQKLD